MKKFLRKTTLFFIYCILIIALPAYIIDPYNVFHWKNIKNNGINPNHNYIKTKYLLSNPELFDGFVYGSSRVGAIHVEKMTNSKIYNMTASGATPKESYDSIKTLLNGNVQMDIIYLGVDSYSYTTDPASHYYSPLSSPYEYLTANPKAFIHLYFNPSVTLQGFIEMQNKKDIEGFHTFYDYGWWCDYNRKATTDLTTAPPFIGDSNLFTETLQDIQNIKTLCNENNIKLVVFTNPMYDVTYRTSIDYYNYLDFLSELSKITNYYNFSSLNDITLNQNNFLDTSHYNAEVGDILISSMLYENTDPHLLQQGFGYYVTQDNISNLINILQEQLTE